LVIYGIPEDNESDDKEGIDNIVGSVLHIDPVRNVGEVMRVGRKTVGKIRPIRVRAGLLRGKLKF